jgi:hypothetical protein
LYIPQFLGLGPRGAAIRDGGGAAPDWGWNWGMAILAPGNNSNNRMPKSILDRDRVFMLTSLVERIQLSPQFVVSTQAAASRSDEKNKGRVSVLPCVL